MRLEECLKFCEGFAEDLRRRGVRFNAVMRFLGNCRSKCRDEGYPTYPVKTWIRVKPAS